MIVSSPNVTDEQVMQYLASDPAEQNVYRSIIIKIKEIASELETALNEPILAESLYSELMKNAKGLADLVMLRKLYISGIIPNPRSAEVVLTETKDPKGC